MRKMKKNDWWILHHLESRSKTCIKLQNGRCCIIICDTFLKNNVYTNKHTDALDVWMILCECVRACVWQCERARTLALGICVRTHAQTSSALHGQKNKLSVCRGGMKNQRRFLSCHIINFFSVWKRNMNALPQLQMEIEWNKIDGKIQQRQQQTRGNNHQTNKQ